jgi:selenocysteine lyase/cysteine desulfurase
MNRNQFLTTLGALTGGTLLARPALANCLQSDEKGKKITDETSFWKFVRAQFLFPEDYSYLNTGGIGAVPILVLNHVKASMDKMEIYPRPGHDHEKWLMVKETCCKLLGEDCLKEELAFTSTATEGINIVINGLNLKQGDEVITSTHEHPALHIPLLNQVKSRGIVLKTFQPDLVNGSGNIQRISEQITHKTRLIFISHVTCTTGQILPIKEIADLAKSKGILLAVDGAQAVGQIPVDLKDSGVDCYAFSGHKWMLGPKRTGVLYVNSASLEAIQPVTVGAYSDDGYDIESRMLTYHPTAQRFEYGTQNESLFHGLQEGVEFILTIGLKRIIERNRKMAETFFLGLKDISAITILSPEEEKCRSSMITFKSKSHDYRDIAAYLSEKRIRVRVVNEANLKGIRVSFHLYNDESDVEKILNEIKSFLTA